MDPSRYLVILYRARRGAIAGFAGAAAVFLASGALWAREEAALLADTVEPEPTALVYRPAVESRRAEWLRVLTTVTDLPADAAPRRRLTRAEREALNEELRAVMRSAYQAGAGQAD